MSGGIDYMERSFVHFVHLVVVPEEGEPIDSPLSLHSGRGSAKNRSAGGGTRDDDRVGAEQSSCKRGLSSRYLYIIHPQKKRFLIEKRTNTKKEGTHFPYLGKISQPLSLYKSLFLAIIIIPRRGGAHRFPALFA